MMKKISFVDATHIIFNILLIIWVMILAWNKAITSMELLIFLMYFRINWIDSEIRGLKRIKENRQ